jgi:hypothetical protein
MRGPANRSGRGLVTVLTITAGAIGAALLAVYALSSWQLDRRVDAPLVPLRVAGPPDLVEGERMARIVGRRDGCHGRRGEGGVEAIDGIVRHSAPTLTPVLRAYPDDELVRLIRYGVKRDGRSAVGMPSATLWALGDRDLANFIAHPRLPTCSGWRTPPSRTRKLPGSTSSCARSAAACPDRRRARTVALLRPAGDI